MKIEEAINFPDTLYVDLTRYKEIRIRRDTRIYKINIDKFLEEFGTLVEVVYDESVED